MMRLLVTSGVSNHTHPAVTLQFFECVARYEKFFACEPEYIPSILAAFLDSRGMRNKNPRVSTLSLQSYVCNIFSFSVVGPGYCIICQIIVCNVNNEHNRRVADLDRSCRCKLCEDNFYHREELSKFKSTITGTCV